MFVLVGPKYTYVPNFSFLAKKKHKILRHPKYNLVEIGVKFLLMDHESWLYY